MTHCRNVNVSADAKCRCRNDDAKVKPTLMCMLALLGDTVMRTDVDLVGDCAGAQCHVCQMQRADDNVILHDEWWVDGPNAGQLGLSAQRVDGLRPDS